MLKQLILIKLEMYKYISINEDNNGNDNNNNDNNANDKKIKIKIIIIIIIVMRIIALEVIALIKNSNKKNISIRRLGNWIQFLSYHFYYHSHLQLLYLTLLITSHLRFSVKNVHS